VRLLALGTAGCWLLLGQRSAAQGTFIYHTVLTNPDPGGIFGPDGMPVYTVSGGGPFGQLPVDLNHDGAVDYNVVATGTSTWGFQLQGVGNNLVWARPTGGADIGAAVVPLSQGTQIGSGLPGGDQWTATEPTPYGINAPYFSAYSSIGGIGLFIDQTAYAGLQFRIGAEVYYGWVRVQEIPGLAGGGIVYEYAFDTRPNTPIFAGAVPEPSTAALLAVSGVTLWFLRKRRFVWISTGQRAAWVRGASLALMLTSVAGKVCAQGTVVFHTPSQPTYYGPVDGSHSFDLDGDGVTDYVLAFDISGARLNPFGSNSVIVDGGNLVAAINQGESISPSPVGYYWLNANAVLGGQAVFDGQYFYAGNFSGRDAFIGLLFQYGGATHCGWMEVNNDQDIAAGQVLGWAYETRPDTPIFAGAVPEPSTAALLAASGVTLWFLRKRRFI
jgi:hypothetical protein